MKGRPESPPGSDGHAARNEGSTAADPDAGIWTDEHMAWLDDVESRELAELEAGDE